MQHHVLRLDAPGTAFHESMLLGNGWMGQAIHGQPEHETLELSHIAFYSGSPDEDAPDAAAPEYPSAWRGRQRLTAIMRRRIGRLKASWEAKNSTAPRCRSERCELRRRWAHGGITDEAWIWKRA